MPLAVLDIKYSATAIDFFLRSRIALFINNLQTLDKKTQHKKLDSSQKIVELAHLLQYLCIRYEFISILPDQHIIKIFFAITGLIHLEFTWLKIFVIIISSCFIL